MKSRHAAAETGNDSRKREWRHKTAVTVRRQILLTNMSCDRIYRICMYVVGAESLQMAIEHALNLYDFNVSVVIMDDLIT